MGTCTPPLLGRAQCLTQYLTTTVSPSTNGDINTEVKRTYTNNYKVKEGCYLFKHQKDYQCKPDQLTEHIKHMKGHLLSQVTRLDRWVDARLYGLTWQSGNESKPMDHFRRVLKITCEMSHKLMKVRYSFEVSLIT